MVADWSGITPSSLVIEETKLGEDGWNKVFFAEATEIYNSNHIYPINLTVFHK
jgi:hypothetical protein